MKINECPVCGSKSREEVAALLNRANFCVCNECGHGYILDGPDADYSGFRQNYTDEQLMDENCSLNQMAEQRYRYIMKNVNFTKTGKCSILDVGCGYGHFLNKFILWSKTGIEPSVIAANYLRKMNTTISIHPGDYKSYSHVMDNFREGKDIISAHHVIEHLTTPKELIEFCIKYSTPQGLIYLTLPTVDDIENYEPTLTDLYFLSHGLHTQLFSYPSLLKLLSQFNIKWYRYEKEPFWPGLGNSYSLVLQSGVNNSRFYPEKEMASMGVMLVKRFFQKLDILQMEFSEYVYDTKNYKKAIYGAGTHTYSMIESLFEWSDIVPKKVFPLIIDDNPREEEMFGIPIMPLEEALNYKFSGILISAPASEEQIGKRLKEDDRIKCRVFGPPPKYKPYKR